MQVRNLRRARLKTGGGGWGLGSEPWCLRPQQGKLKQLEWLEELRGAAQSNPIVCIPRISLDESQFILNVPIERSYSFKKRSKIVCLKWEGDTMVATIQGCKWFHSPPPSKGSIGENPSFQGFLEAYCKIYLRNSPDWLQAPGLHIWKGRLLDILKVFHTSGPGSPAHLLLVVNYIFMQIFCVPWPFVTDVKEYCKIKMQKVMLVFAQNLHSHSQVLGPKLFHQCLLL